MKPFSIGEVREVFAADLARFQSETAAWLVQALANPAEPLDYSMVQRHAHTMRGMASLVHAAALTSWADDLQGLFARAEAAATQQPRDVTVLLNWVSDQLLIWGELTEATLREAFQEADAVYAKLRPSLENLLSQLTHDVVPQPALVTPVFRNKADSTGASPSLEEPRMGKPSMATPPALVLPQLKRVSPEATRGDDSFPPRGPAKLGGPPALQTPTFKRSETSADRTGQGESITVRSLQETPSGAPFKPMGLAVVPPKFKSASALTQTAPSPVAPVVTAPSARFDTTHSVAPTSLTKKSTSPQTSRVSRDRSQEMLAAFAMDARDQLEALEQAIIRLERNEDLANQLAMARRAFHTLKGAANSVGLAPLGGSFHEVEDFVEKTSSQEGNPLPTGFCPFLLACVDDLRTYMRVAEEGSGTGWSCDWQNSIASILEGKGMAVRSQAPKAVESTPSRDSTPNKPEEVQTLRVDARRLRNLVNLMGELVVDRNRLERELAEQDAGHDHLAESHARITQLVAAFQKEFEFNLLKNNDTRYGQSSNRLSGGGGISSLAHSSANPSEGSGFSELEFDRYDQFSVFSRQLVEVANDLEEVIRGIRVTHREFTQNHQKFSKTSKQMQEEVTGLSLVPVQTLFTRLIRVFRDAIQSEQKDADLHFDGGATLLDKNVMDAIYAPMLHILRNAVAHGLESKEARAKTDKAPKGQVQVRAHAAGNHVFIDVQDDGQGIDVAKVRAHAISRGLLPAEAPEELSFTDAIGFLFTPGFSTAEKLTSMSGRGVGLDVVRTEVESLGGTIQIANEVGRGSTWTIRLPLTLSVTEAILCTLGGRTFALPVNFLERGVVINPAQITESTDGVEQYVLAEEVLPVIHLADLLGFPERPAAPHGLVLRVGLQKALVLLEPGFINQEIVVKPLDSLVSRHPLLSGATISGEGHVIFILSVPGILQAGASQGSRSGIHAGRSIAPTMARRVAVKPRILVVDDSLSVRKVQERILTDLGCDVVTANDGLQALERLREMSFQLIITDLEMPGMDGYQLITETRNLPRHAKTPIVVVSSRSTARYTERAITLGANTCLSKPFSEEHIDGVIDQYVRLNAPEAVVA